MLTIVEEMLYISKFVTQATEYDLIRMNLLQKINNWKCTKRGTNVKQIAQEFEQKQMPKFRQKP